MMTNIYAQEGHIYLSHYDINESYSDSKIKSIAFDDQSSVLLASRKGVAVFNGTQWKRVQNIPANVSCIKADSTSKIIFTGLKDEFGFITRDSLGIYKYQPIRQFKENTGIFSQIVITSTKVVFYSDRSIYMVDLANHENIELLKNKDNTKYGGILKRNDNLYVNVIGQGVCKIEGLEPVLLKYGKKFKNTKILFNTTCNKVNILIGTDNNELFLFNGKKFVQFSNKTEVRDFLKENILWNGFDFSDKYFAINTLTGGCVIIDKIYGKIKYNINYMTGLPDDEIFAMGMGKNKSLWMAHQHGLSSCDLELNLRNYTPYPGIYGNINDVLIKNNRLYVASNNGVYILTEITDVKEKEYFIKEKVNYGQGYDFKKKKKLITHSLGHKFVPVVNLSDKCKRLLEFESQVFAVSDFGIYKITDSLAQPLIKDIYINALWAEKDTSVLLASSLKGIQLLSYTVDSVTGEQSWNKRRLIEELQQAVYSIVQDDSGNLIFGTEGKAYFAKKDSLLYYAKLKEIQFPEKINEPINVQKVNGRILFIQSAGIFVYDENNQSVDYDNKQDFEQRNFRFIESSNNTWVYKGNSWNSLNSIYEVQNKQYWNLFPKIRRLHIDSLKNTWLINGKKELIKVLTDTIKKDYNFNIHITKISDISDSIYNLSNPVFEYRKNAIKVEMSAPFRLYPQGTRYRFKVKGLPNYEEWSKWSNNSTIELSYIPAGDYELIVNAQNILGQVSNQKNVNFTVLKPFWQTTAFYAIAAGSFIIFTLLVFYLSRLRLKRKNRILETKVRERTIELQEEKDKTEELLLNILPKETAEELKLNNKVVPRSYDIATVLFTDFKGFTMIAEKLSPEELVYEIDYCFREFDKIISKYRIEKIKTIGDAYMCAAGLPKEDKNNALEMAKAALEIRDFMETHKMECKKANKPCFEIRIGLHTGKVVAGVVGTKKYAYDIWGDTVNLAARMESSGEPGKVNVSGDTYKLVKEEFYCSHRGKIEAKNKGQVDMYFIEGTKN